MIKIKTTLVRPAQPTLEWRKFVAGQLARFMPDYSESSGVPYPTDQPDGPWVLDIGNDWWCEINEHDSQLITITYRYAATKPEKERAFVNWVVACRSGWEIV